jgi:hypothetical protein
MGKLNRGQKLPTDRRPSWIVSIEVGPTTMRKRPAWIVSEVGTIKGWVCGVTEEDSDWLGSYTGPHTQEVWTGRPLGCATRLRSLMGTSDHLCRV